MTNPTHRLKATGDLVFPEGYDPADIELLPEDFWNADPWAVDHARDSRWDEFKRRSEEVLAEGVMVPGIGKVDSNAPARDAINWHFTSSLVDPEGFTIEWTLADNTRTMIDAEGMRKIKLTVDDHVRGVREQRDDFRDRLQASQTVLGVKRVKSPFEE